MTEITVTLDDAALERTKLTCEALQRNEPSLSEDDCINALFAIGLMQVFTGLTLQYINEQGAGSAPATANFPHDDMGAAVAA